MSKLFPKLFQNSNGTNGIKMNKKLRYNNENALIIIFILFFCFVNFD